MMLQQTPRRPRCEPWLPLARCRGAAALTAGSPRDAFAAGAPRGSPATSPHPLCFPGPDALFSAADAAGAGKGMALRGARARPGDAGFFFPLYGVFVPSAIRKKEGAKHPGGLLPWGSVSSRPGGDAEGRKRGAERPKNSLGMLCGCARPLCLAPKCLLHGMGLGTGIGMGWGQGWRWG